jgi:ribosome-binding factor A
VQIDLLFDRKDNVITLCEMKYSLSPVGMDIIEEIEGKAEIISNKFRNKTIQKVLISRSKPTNDLASCGFFFRIIKPEEFF